MDNLGFSNPQTGGISLPDAEAVSPHSSAFPRASVACFRFSNRNIPLLDTSLSSSKQRTSFFLIATRTPIRQSGPSQCRRQVEPGGSDAAHVPGTQGSRVDARLPDRQGKSSPGDQSSLGDGSASRANIRAFSLALILLALSCTLLAQSNTGELRLKITDPDGLGVKGAVELVSEANEFRLKFATGDSGTLIAKNLPFGVYRIAVEREGFAPYSGSVEIHSAVPAEFHVKLALASMASTVVVSGQETLIDPYRTMSVNRIGAQTIEDRSTSLPGRSLQDLVNSEPGWLYEGNAVLHPRGSEYQTQFVVDGIPLIDNRSPSFGPEIEADDVQSISIYTAGIPAEYGRKMGGVVEVNTLEDPQAGLHGQVALSGGSFDTAGAFSQVQYAWGKNTLGASASGSMSDRYLNPVVPENFTNTGTTGDFAARYERDLTSSDRLSFSVRHELSRFEVPNELVQEAAGQRQDRDDFETMGVVAYQHIFSPNVVADLRGMVRDASNDLSSNPESTPIIAFQHNDFREGYFKGGISIHRGRHELKAGIESDATFLHENFSDIITNFAGFDPGTPSPFFFPGTAFPNSGHRPDLEQSAFVQDTMRLGKWTISAGLRWDHYQLLVNQNAASPRLAVARYWQSAGLVLHASYDRVFQTPDFENILVSSSLQVVALNPNVLRLPVQPSHGNYYEVGLTKGFFRALRLDVNYFRRLVNNYADDDQLLSTAISFPIAFRKSIIYGSEAKIEIPHWRGLSGFASYSYIVGNAWFPVTGGLFLGDDALTAATQLTGHFPDSQDQRNTFRTRFRYQLVPRVWVAAGAEYGSGLPVDFDGTEQQAIQQFGPEIASRVNFSRGRVRPQLSVDASIGADLWKRDNFTMRLQADIQNLNDRLNVIDFAGLFSGTAIAPPRSYAFRFQTIF
jgi:TonB-dependent receptor-like protein